MLIIIKSAISFPVMSEHKNGKEIVEFKDVRIKKLKKVGIMVCRPFPTQIISLIKFRLICSPKIIYIKKFLLFIFACYVSVLLLKILLCLISMLNNINYSLFILI